MKNIGIDAAAVGMKPTKRRKKYAYGMDARTQSELQVMVWPAMFFMILFNFLPLFGLIIAFTNYSPINGIAGIFDSAWNNFANFMFVFKDVFFWPMIRNTLGINILGMIVGFPVTIMFAFLLNEIASQKFRSFIQTITYLPHFLSWVIYGGLIMNMLSPTTGVVNWLLLHLHLVHKPVEFMANPKYFWGLAVTTGLLKDLGWGAILYLAAIAGVEQSQYEAAAIDGAGRFKRMWHITLPGILGTVMIMVIFSISGILNNNFNQIYVLQNSLNLPTSQVIATYVYQIGLQQFQFAYGTAVGLMNSVIALVLLVGSNLLSKKLTGKGLF